MGVWDWLRRRFRSGPRMMDGVPEVLGEVTDPDGRRQVLYRGPIQHDSLTPDQHRRIRRLRETLIEAYPMTLNGWLDGFRRDADPESEIRLVEACAVVYRELTSRAPLEPDEKQRLYAVVCALSAGGRGPTLAAALPAGLPDLEQIAGMLSESIESGSRP